MLLWAMVTGYENNLLVKPWAGEMNLGAGWEFDVQGAKKERWASFHRWYHVKRYD